jgi:hypothetical protein
LKRFDRYTSGKEPVSILATGRQALASSVRFAQAIFMSVPATDTTADELFERAAAYEATQPGYAADLRAAARQAQGRHFGGW